MEGSRRRWDRATVCAMQWRARVAGVTSPRDIALVLVLCAVAVAEISSGSISSPASRAAYAVATIAGLLVRRSYPLLAVGLVSIGLVAQSLLLESPEEVGVLVADHRRGLLVGGLRDGQGRRHRDDTGEHRRRRCGRHRPFRLCLEHPADAAAVRVAACRSRPDRSGAANEISSSSASKRSTGRRTPRRPWKPNVAGSPASSMTWCPTR